MINMGNKDIFKKTWTW